MLMIIMIIIMLIFNYYDNNYDNVRKSSFYKPIRFSSFIIYGCNGLTPLV